MPHICGLLGDPTSQVCTVQSVLKENFTSQVVIPWSLAPSSGHILYYKKVHIGLYSVQLSIFQIICFYLFFLFLLITFYRS